MSYGPRPWLQKHWDIRAAANFVFGGTGSGLLFAWALVAPAAPDWWLFVTLGAALMGAGLTAVWLEIGRKARALHVFFNPQTSWMTREAYAAVLVFALVIAALALGMPGIARGAAVAALIFLWCQGRILRASKGIPAWRAPEVVALVITTGLAEGAALYLALRFDALALTLLALALLARALAWSRYRDALQEPSRAVLDPAGKALVQLGTIAPLALLLAAYWFEPAALLAALAVIATGWRLKLLLVTRAALNQGFALPRLPVRGAR